MNGSKEFLNFPNLKVQRLNLRHFFQINSLSLRSFQKTTFRFINQQRYVIRFLEVFDKYQVLPLHFLDHLPHPVVVLGNNSVGLLAELPLELSC